MNFLAEMQILQGKLRQAAATSQEVISKLGERASIHSSRAYSRLSLLSREWNELDLAASQMQQAITLGEQAGQNIYMSTIYLASVQVLWARGEVKEAMAFRAQLELSQGNLAQAEHWGEKAGI